MKIAFLLANVLLIFLVPDTPIKDAPNRVRRVEFRKPILDPEWAIVVHFKCIDISDILRYVTACDDIFYVPAISLWD